MRASEPPSHGFRPLLSPERSAPPDRYRTARRIVYLTLGVIVGVNVLVLLFGADGALRGRPKTSGEITQEVFVKIDRVNPATSTISVVGDLVGIMGIEVLVTPQTWIGVDRRLGAFGELQQGRFARISFVREGERRVARWIAMTSPESRHPRAADAPEPIPEPAAAGKPAPAR